jgi:hypothetical protein
MKDKQTLYIVLVIALVVIIGAIWHSRAKAPKSQVVPQDLNQNRAQQPQPAQPGSGNFWEGTLKITDNPTKGNLMLATATASIYINTRRDYSSLVGKQVRISYDGTMQSFRLGDIVEK